MEGLKLMKIAIVVNDNINILNGTTVRVKQLVFSLKKQHIVTIVTSSPKTFGDGLYTGVKVINVGGSSENWVTSKLHPTTLKLIRIIIRNVKLAFIIKKNKVDAIYCAHDWVGFITLYLFSKVNGYKLIFEAHSIYSEEYKEISSSNLGLRIRRMLEKFVIQHSNQVIALSSNTFQFYQKYNRHIELIPVYVDDELFFQSYRKQKDINFRSVGLIGPFNDARKQASLQFLYSNINKFDNRLRFSIIGSLDERMKMQNEKITYVGYLDSDIEYNRQLCQLDAVLVAESLATSGPLNKIIEPMACGVPVFTTPIGMVGLYWVKPGRDIFVFERDKLADKANELIFDNELMRNVGQNAQKIIKEYYSRNVNEKKLLNILQKLGGV